MDDDDDRTRRISQLRAEIAARQAELLKLAKEHAADVAGLMGKEREAFMGLTSSSEQGNSVNNMFTSHPLATSAGRGKNDPMIRLANRAGYTLRSLAEAVDMSPAALSMARRGTRSVRERAAKKIEALIGFKATAAHWPGGISGE